jgi:restriction endonuclease S subunit
MIIFTKEKQTTEYMDFYNMENNGELKKIKSLSKIELQKNNYSFKLQDYEEEKLNENINYVKLGDISIIQNGKRIVKSRSPPGDYPVYGGGYATFYTNQYNREGKNCKISREGMSLKNCVLCINGPFYLNSQAFTVISNDENKFLSKYIWMFLLYNKEKIMACGRGTAQLAIDVKQFQKIKIPNYSIEKQREIIQELEELDNISQNYKNQLKSLKKEREFFYKYNNNDLKSFTNGKETIKLEDIINFEKKSKRAAKVGKKEGKYPFYKSGKKISRSDFNDYQNQCIIIGDGGESCVNFASNFACSDHNYIFNTKDNNVFLNEYLYYFLKINIHIIRSLMKGVAIKNLSKTSLKNIKIPKLSLEEQQKYIELAKKKMNKINSFEQKREELKQHIEELNQIGKNIIIN